MTGFRATIDHPSRASWMIKSTGIACHEFQWRSNQSRAFHQSARRTPDNDPTEPNNERRPTLSGAHSNCGTQPAIAETLCLDFQDQGRENRSFAASIRRSFILGRCRRVPPGSRSLSLTAANFAFPHRPEKPGHRRRNDRPRPRTQDRNDRGGRGNRRAARGIAQSRSLTGSGLFVRQAHAGKRGRWLPSAKQAGQGSLTGETAVMTISTGMVTTP